MLRKGMLNAAIVTATLCFAAGIAFVSLQPCAHTTLAVRIVNNCGHVPAYAVLAILLYLVFRVLFSCHAVAATVLSGALSIAFGVVMEIEQGGISGRSRSWEDMILNMLGILIGMLLIRRVFVSAHERAQR